jgi:ubiquinone/menaquinone biosynthesis C-methylase UbiE
MEKVESVGNVFDEMGQYWVEIADKDQTQRQIEFLKSQLKPDGVILDVACGSGRHLIALSEAGYSTVGLDVSARLLKIAKMRGALQLVRGDMRFLPFKKEAFAAAISMDTSFGYLPTEQEDAKSLAEVRRVLCVGGEFILDVFNRDHLVRKYAGKASEPKLYEYPSFTLQQQRTVSDDGERLRDLWTIQDKASGQVRVFGHSVRLYQRPKLEGLLETTGLATQAVYGDYEEQSYSAEAPRLILKASIK